MALYPQGHPQHSDVEVPVVVLPLRIVLDWLIDTGDAAETDTSEMNRLLERAVLELGYETIQDAYFALQAANLLAGEARDFLDGQG